MHSQQYFFVPAQWTLRACALAAALLGAQPAHAGAADADERPQWTFGGFGTLGVAHADTRDADFTAGILKSHGAGYTRRVSPEVDSRVGAQLDVQLNARWSGVLQLVSEQQINGSFRPKVEWGNVKYQATPDLALRVGRIALPVFLAADYRKVGYAYPWVRPPVEVYNTIPITHSDGVDVTWRWRAAGFKHSVQGFAGRHDIDLLHGDAVRVRRVNGLTYTAEQGALTLRGTALGALINVRHAQADNLLDAFRQFGPQGVALAERYSGHDKRGHALGLSAAYDPGQWFVQAELGRKSMQAWHGSFYTMVASAGWRHGAFTPYAAVARVRARPVRETGLPVTGLPPQLAGVVSALNGGLTMLLRQVPAQQSTSAGVRWDFASNYALKIQVDRVRPSQGSPGTLVNLQPGFQSDRAVLVTSAAVDFVF